MANKEGYLTLSPEFRDIVPGDGDLTGVAAASGHLFMLRSGRLYIFDQADLTVQAEITGISDMSGRLSVVSPHGNFAILTSEGTDQGYWIDLRDLSYSEDIPAHSLGIDPPDPSDFSITNQLKT